MANILVLSLPRSGSSLLCELVESAGYKLELFEDSTYLNPSNLNQRGYREEVRFTLLNDQLLRVFYSNETSFLNTKCLQNEPSFRKDFHYDIDEFSLWLPNKYENRLIELTGNSWDIWGLTRMSPGKKWYRCYEKFDLHSAHELIAVKSKYESLLNSTSGYVLKDPRLALTLKFYKFDTNNFKVLIINRDPKSVLSSCRNHYGPNIFLEKYIDQSNIVSNHFNYKIGFQNFESWRNSYYDALNLIATKYETMKINYEDFFKDRSNVKQLEKFIDAKINLNLIDAKLKNY